MCVCAYVCARVCVRLSVCLCVCVIHYQVAKVEGAPSAGSGVAVSGCSSHVGADFGQLCADLRYIIGALSEGCAVAVARRGGVLDINHGQAQTDLNFAQVLPSTQYCQSINKHSTRTIENSPICTLNHVGHVLIHSQPWVSGPVAFSGMSCDLPEGTAGFWLRASLFGERYRTLGYYCACRLREFEKWL